MPGYYLLRQMFKEKQERNLVTKKLQSLRRSLSRSIPAKDANDNLLLATWNIRDFDKENRRGYGKRIPESFFYIAEILSRFDFIAVQEINRLEEWQTVMRILGPNWDYIATDVTDPTLGGNGERLTYVFDKRKVTFQNIAGEIVLPKNMLISKVEIKKEKDKLVQGKQFRRTPFVASFQSGWFKFDICTVHIYYGAASGKKLEERIEEIATITDYLGKRADIGLKENRALILLGDFNNVSPEYKTMKALQKNGFSVPKEIQRLTNVKETMYYDQIAFKTSKGYITYTAGDKSGGVFKPFKSCFTDQQIDDYKKFMKPTSVLKKKYNGDYNQYYPDWKTYQISDHNPLWIRLDVNNSTEYLNSLLKEK